jgi:hypothetical protein
MLRRSLLSRHLLLSSFSFCFLYCFFIFLLFLKCVGRYVQLTTRPLTPYRLTTPCATPRVDLKRPSDAAALAVSASTGCAACFTRAC